MATKKEIKKKVRASSTRTHNRRKTPWYSRAPRWVLVLGTVIALALLGTGGAVSYAKYKLDSLVPRLPIIGTIVYTAPTANEQAIDLPTSVTDLVTQAADASSGFRLVRVDGDGTISSKVVDATPKLPDGEVAKVEARKRDATNALLDNLKGDLNGAVATVSGESLLGGLQRLTNLDTTKPVILIGSLLDTTSPFDFRSLGFDTNVPELADKLKQADELPKLDGADIRIVVRGTAGDQPQLRTVQNDYRQAAWSTVLKASGASSVSFSYPDGSTPTATVPAPVVPIPPPPSTPVVPESTPTGTICTLLGGTYFQPDKPVLLDRVATLKAIEKCVAAMPPGAKVTVTGYTAGADPKNSFALTLSQQRADVVRDLLVALGIAKGDITTFGKGNSNDRPYPKAPDDPRNRCVVITADTGTK
ncbi:outer membrane protein OmpA-like peptidoglycan-associated protein [Humibacillus xanthopallidus]|uniref:Outer membrane protein OmpA-like peptidoglycan-associated protein n=1 Tax=Humibacillus xanthopallidus TaxID=412689 RepID=A0A543PQZ8_9MICO|nr:OmpA family protein [Humibacillus xanthopallidus]TQN46503.1 outer membrane protein OmpA-like peptidoglycan-associated protein [Humibacillus xanthopallidus]